MCVRDEQQQGRDITDGADCRADLFVLHFIYGHATRRRDDCLNERRREHDEQDVEAECDDDEGGEGHSRGVRIVDERLERRSAAADERGAVRRQRVGGVDGLQCGEEVEADVDDVDESDDEEDEQRLQPGEVEAAEADAHAAAGGAARHRRRGKEGE